MKNIILTKYHIQDIGKKRKATKNVFDNLSYTGESSRNRYVLL